MALITWNESMSVGVEEIDNQHQKFVGIINDLFDALKAVRGIEVLDDILNRLIDYADYHFSTEEKYFDEFGYSASDVHKAEHKHFIEEVREFKGALDAGDTKRDGSDTPLSTDLWLWLRDWIMNHIQVSDKKFGPLFREKGLK